MFRTGNKLWIVVLMFVFVLNCHYVLYHYAHDPESLATGQQLKIGKS